MVYNSDKHRRRSIRLKNYDYSQSGAYFITICARNKQPYFKMFPELREIIDQQWNNIPRRFPSVSLHEYIIMPDHLHGILIVGATLVVARKTMRAGSSPAPTIGSIIGAFKSLCAGKWLAFIRTGDADLPVKIWRRNYFEHVIRNDSELNEIRNYIINNPVELETKRQFDNL